MGVFTTSSETHSSHKAAAHNSEESTSINHQETLSAAEAVEGSIPIQAKLNIGQPNDKYEQEADHMAEQVMRMEKTDTATALEEEPEVQREPLADQITPLIQKEEDDEETVEETNTSEEEVIQEKPLTPIAQRQEEEEEIQDLQAKEEGTLVEEETEKEQATPVQRQEEEELQAKEESTLTEDEVIQEQPIHTPLQRQEEEEELQKKTGGNSETTGADVEQQINSSKGGGHALPGQTQDQMSGAFGADFSGVNIHTDQQASSLSQQLNAKAFTVGNDIYFNSNQYNPDSSDGKRLLAHELTHTVQQGASETVQRETLVQKDDSEEEIKDFLKSIEEDVRLNIESGIEFWEEKNEGFTPQERAAKLKEIRKEEVAFFKATLDDEYIRSAGLDPATVRTYVERKAQEIETQTKQIAERAKAVEQFPDGFEGKYQELIDLVEEKIKALADLIGKSSQANPKAFYQIQLEELQALKSYLGNEDVKKFYSIRKKPNEHIDGLKETIKEYPHAYNPETFHKDMEIYGRSAQAMDSFASGVEVYIEFLLKGDLDFSISLIEEVFTQGNQGEGEGADEDEEPPVEEPPVSDEDTPVIIDDLIDDEEPEEDPELSDEEIVKEEQAEEFKDFMSLLNEIATPDEELEGDYQKFIETLEGMSPEERERFLEYLKGMLDPNADEAEGEGKSLNVYKALEDYSKLTELDKKVLDTNQKLRQDSTNPKGENITIDFRELEEPVNDKDQTAQEVLKELSQAESILSKIKEQAGVKDNSLNIDPGWAPFLTEMSVFYALLAGAGKRSAAVKDISADLMENLKKLKDEINKEILKAAALAIVTSPGGPAAQAAAIGLKLNKVRKLVEVGQKVYDVGNKISSFIQVVQDPKLQETLAELEGKFQQIEELEKKLSAYSSLDDDTVEDELFELEEKLREDLIALVATKGDTIMEFLYIPEPENAEPDAIVDELIKILYDLPKGLAAFETMSQTYTDLNSKGNPTKEDLALLSLQAVDTGVYLYPFVGFLAEEANNALDGLGEADFLSTFGKSKSSRKRSKKYKRAPKDKDKRKEDSKKKFEKLDRNKYNYDNQDLKNDYLNKYEKLFEEYLHKPENTLYKGMWTPGYFKYVVRNFYKEIKPQVRKETVKATPKGSKSKTKVNAPAPPFKLTGWNLKGNQYSFDLKVNPLAGVETLTNVTMDYNAFKKYAGIPYTFAAMGSTKDKRIRKKEVKKWLTDNGYEFTYEVDGTGKPLKNENHIHIRRGKQEKEYLHINNGIIYQGVHTDINKAYKNFLGKKIKKNIDLPEGYVLKRAPSLTDPHRQTVSRKKGLPSHMRKLNWGGSILTEGALPKSPTPIRTLTPPSVASEGKSDGYDYEKSIERMFDITPGQPEKPKAGFNMQKKDTIAKWQAYLNPHKHDPTGAKRRPTKVEADFGYVINARAHGDNLSKYKLPEMKNSDDNGHLIARRFGAVEYYDNLIPMDRTTNQKGEWSKIEHAMAQKYVGKSAIAGNYVQTTIDIHYDNGETRRPKNFDISWQEKTSSGINQAPIPEPTGGTRKVSDSKKISNK